ncbi:hypothetical protein [Chondromyces apiculatus]|uniref:Uncharacterized protein n=1 Tax=Chondromyces apiculatus DSM 436 TaxID=1192034 RepID=A0A017TIG7_9BACT|nr:hypothetical protein [Chondromyces apiculatus]EYF08692.1 Hypothetical protein CAP_2553 [Chondromyces apiculatus DSM 436]
MRTNEGNDEQGREMVLRSGYAVDVVDGGGHEVLRLRAPDGRICLKISLSPSGPEVELSSVGLSIVSDGDVRVACDRFEVAAKSGLTLATGGSLHARAEGDLETEAFAQRHRARSGDVALVANDDVTLDGERIRLNTPRPLEPKGKLPPR